MFLLETFIISILRGRFTGDKLFHGVLLLLSWQIHSKSPLGQVGYLRL
uniref:L-aspartate oxidase-like protein n=1 Tax=Arabidopsis thaliana TaxID=3702 RepID=Q93Y13_ARATH|nr:L-aspartate oxidase-like protein [Arabidopsis thaliana]